MTKTTVSFTAVYDDEHAALRDLDALEGLYEEEWIGKYDAAVVRMKDGEPHIVTRVDHPRGRVIPELLGHGALPGDELKQAAEKLPDGAVGLVVVGEVSPERAFEDVVTRAVRTAQRDFTTTTDQLAGEMIADVKAGAARGDR